MKSKILLLLILNLHLSCSKQNPHNLENYLNNNFLKTLINNDTLSNFYTDQDYGKMYFNDSIGINDFICHLICLNYHINHMSLMQDYFGFHFLNSNEKIDLKAIPALLLQFMYVPNEKRFNYLDVAFDFYLKNNNLRKNYIYNIFFMTLYMIRNSNYENINDYTNILEKLYNEFIANDELMADFVLDVLRKSNNDFIKGKYFISPEFNSQEFIQKYKDIGDNDFKNYIK